MAEYTGANFSTLTLARKYTYGEYVDEPLTTTDHRNGGNNTYYYHRNRQYSVTALSDSTGQVVERYSYTPHGEATIFSSTGNITPTSIVANHTTFTGRDHDQETGLYYRARMYSPQNGNFISRDPLHYVDGASVYLGYFVPWSMDASGYGPGPDIVGDGGFDGIPDMSCGNYYCGPESDELLLKELNYAYKTWSRNINKHAKNDLSMYVYRSKVRWAHMLAIGPQLDWTTLTSERFKEDGKLITCPTGKCKDTYMICGSCVHDHFIGNIMYGFWIRLHGFTDLTGYLAGNVAQLAGDTSSRGLDKSWDVAGYKMGFSLYDAVVKDGKNLDVKSMCDVLKYGNGGGNKLNENFDKANETGGGHIYCKKCPKPLDGGTDPWTKEKGKGKGYPPF